MTATAVFLYEDGSAFLMARALGNAGTAITQASISSIAYKVTRLDTEAAVSNSTLTVADVVFDTLQTDARWTADSTGYNFGWLIPATLLTTGGIPYNIDITFTPTSGGATYAWPLVFRFETIKRFN